MSANERLKQKLCAAIDDLGEADGFVLVATLDDISFTRLKAEGWDERVLELEPLDAAVARRERDILWKDCQTAKKRADVLDAEIAVKLQRLADVEAALRAVLGDETVAIAPGSTP